MNDLTTRPMKSMWVAVICQAIVDLHKKTEMRADRYQRRRLETWQGHADYWLFRDKSELAGSLSWICDHTGLNIGLIRRIAREVTNEKVIMYHFASNLTNSDTAGKHGITRSYRTTHSCDRRHRIPYNTRLKPAGLRAAGMENRGGAK